MPLPREVRLEGPLRLLARWLRLAGVPTRVEPESPPLTSPDGAVWFRARVETGAERPEVILLPRSGWRPQLLTLARKIGWQLGELQPLAVCVGCGGTLEPFRPEEVEPSLPERAPRPSVVYLCTDCHRPTWPGETHDAIQRELRDLFLQHLFRCARCGAEVGDDGGKHLFALKLLSHVGPVRISEEDLEKDLSTEIASLLARIEGQTEMELMDSVAYQREKPLCDPCRGELLGLLREFFSESRRR